MTCWSSPNSAWVFFLVQLQLFSSASAHSLGSCCLQACSSLCAAARQPLDLHSSSYNQYRGYRRHWIFRWAEKACLSHPVHKPLCKLNHTILSLDRVDAFLPALFHCAPHCRNRDLAGGKLSFIDPSRQPAPVHRSDFPQPGYEPDKFCEWLVSACLSRHSSQLSNLRAILSRYNTPHV